MMGGAMSGTEEVLVETLLRVAVVTLNRPERRNALSRSLLSRLWEVMTGPDADDAVDLMILTGADPAFCAGVDLKEAAGATGGLLCADMKMPARGLFPALAKLIGAVNGPAATGGLELALTCDFLIESDRARFADTTRGSASCQEEVSPFAWTAAGRWRPTSRGVSPGGGPPAGSIRRRSSAAGSRWWRGAAAPFPARSRRKRSIR
jgi:hypothetical protein